MSHRYAGEDQRAPGTSFIGSTSDGPGHGLIVLHGDVDAPVVDRLGRHIDEFLAGVTRFLVIDAAAVDSYDTGLLDLLGRTQHRLGGRRGWLRVRGLHPSLLGGPVPASAPASGPASGPGPAERSGSVPEAVS